jgi:hypothetical protein
MLNFVFSNIKFSRSKTEVALRITGEVRNCMNKNFSSVVFRITVFLKDLPVANTTLVINGFGSQQPRIFDKDIEGFNYVEGIEKAVRCDIYPESVY